MRIFFFLVHILPELVLRELFLLLEHSTMFKLRLMNQRCFLITFIRRVTYLTLRLLSTIYSFTKHIIEVPAFVDLTSWVREVLSNGMLEGSIWKVVRSLVSFGLVIFD